jgi:DNA polymerase-3 subunit epsilon
MAKILFYDLETTGVEVRQNGIHQISGCVEIEGLVVESFNFKVAPNPKAKIVAEALIIGGVSEEDIKAYPEMGVVYKQFVKMLSKYIDKYDKKDKMFLCGYNNAHFDDNFFRAFFIQNNDSYFGSWFYAGSLDVMVLASQYLINRRVNMKDFKLKTVAEEIGLYVDSERLHDAEYDIKITREVYRIVSGIGFEI